MMRVAVLIPAHNEHDTIRWCIEGVQASDYPVERIIVVADACTDDTADIARSMGAVVYETDLKDKAAAQNAALWDIGEDIDVIVGFDGDTRPEPTCIRLMIEDLEKHGNDATCSTILPAQRFGYPYADQSLRGRIEGTFFTSSRNFAYALGRRWWRQCQATVGRIQVLTGACYAFKREAIQGIGGFPNGLITADMDATWKLHGAGYKLGYAGDALALTIDPEDGRTYRNQMRRWSSGYYQNMAKHRGQLKNWRSLLVVGTAIFDLVALFWWELFVAWAIISGHHPSFLRALLIWSVIHWVVTTGLAASVVGVKEALIGLVPYTLVNYYNKWLYLCGFTREWILGKHYASWTGRQGRKTQITPMTRGRKKGLSLASLAGAGAGCLLELVDHAASYGLLAASGGLLGTVGYWHLRDKPQGRHKAVDTVPLDDLLEPQDAVA